MKLIFMGSGPFAVPMLEEMHNAGYEFPLVICAHSDAKQNENHPDDSLKCVAERLNIPVCEDPESFDELEELLAKHQPDMILCAGYDRILPREIIRLPQFGCIGVHASLLPRWRGPAPVENALLAGDEKVGVSIFYMDTGIDSGPVISKTSIPVTDKDAEHLYRELSYLGAQMLNLAVQTLMFSVVRPEYQDEEAATYAPRYSSKML